jgi:hypothetical protein
MMGFRTTLILGGLLALWAPAGTAAFVADSARGQAPVPAAPRSGASLFAEDARLAQPVNLEVSAGAVPDIVAMLMKQTGVMLEADAGIAELKASVLARDLPLRSCMGELAALFEAEWSRRGTGKATKYLLARPPQVRRQATRLREQFWERQLEAVSALIRATQAEDAQAALDAANPTVARKWQRPQIPAALRLFDYATRGRYVGEMAVQRPSVSYRDLTSMEKGEARKAMVALAGWQESMGASEPARRLVEASEEPEGIVFTAALSEMYAAGTQPEMKVGERVLSLQARTGNGERILQMGIHVGPMPLPESGARPLPDESQPALRRMLRLTEDARPGSERQGPSLCRVLPEVARQAELSIFADHQHSRPRPVEFSGRWEGSVHDLLRRIETEEETDWTLDGGVLRLRSRRWYVDEERDPPRQLLRTLLTAFRRQGRLDLDDAVRAASMTDAQLEGLKAWAADQDAGDGLWGQVQALADEIGSARPLLRLYSSLSPAQRQALPTGITLESLQVGQQPAFLEAALRLLPTASTEDRARMRLRLDAGENQVAFVALFPNEVRVDRPLSIGAPGLVK